MLKNVANQKVSFWAVDSATLKTGRTGITVTAKISKDGAAGATTSQATATEVDSTDEPGHYQFTLTAAESNANLVIVQPATVTANTRFWPPVAIIYTDLAPASATENDEELVSAMTNAILPIVRDD